MNLRRAFTLTELLVVVAIIAVLAAWLFAANSTAQAKARKTVCLNNLRQINLGVRMYADDSSDAFPLVTNETPAAFTADVQLMKSYVGMTGASPEKARLFDCPADTFYYIDSVLVAQSHHQKSNYYYSSYVFNGGNFSISFPKGTPAVRHWPGIAGRKLSSVREPVKTVLVTECPALLPYSWHQPAGASHYNNALDMVSFVDGHVTFIKIYWNAAVIGGQGRAEAWHYDPPAGYDYKWSGD